MTSHTSEFGWCKLIQAANWRNETFAAKKWLQFVIGVTIPLKRNFLGREQAMMGIKLAFYSKICECEDIHYGIYIDCFDK